MADSPQQTDYALHILRDLRRIIRAVDVHSRQLARESGITVPQLLSLIQIADAGPVTQKDLAARVGLNASTIVGIVDRLEDHKLIVRERSRIDRRQTLLSMTQAGRVLLDSAPSPLQQSLIEGLEQLDESERAQIAEALGKLIRLIDTPAPTSPDSAQPEPTDLSLDPFFSPNPDNTAASEAAPNHTDHGH